MAVKYIDSNRLLTLIKVESMLLQEITWILIADV